MELSMSDASPLREQALNLLAVQCVTHVSGISSLTLVLAEVELPCFPDSLQVKSVGLLLEELVHAAFLSLMLQIKLPRVIILRLNRHVHLNDAIIAPRGILIKVGLVFTHVAATHTAVLLDKSILEPFKDLVVGEFESLN